jgi:hypothetical protein
MNLVLLVSDAGAIHPDGTFSILRGGIDRVWASTFPAVFKGTILVRFQAEPSESATHSWRLCVIDEDGKHVAPNLEGTFTVPESGGNGQFLIGFNIPFKEAGSYSFQVSIDQHLMQAWPFRVIQAEQKKESAK